MFLAILAQFCPTKQAFVAVECVSVMPDLLHCSLVGRWYKHRRNVLCGLPGCHVDAPSSQVLFNSLVVSTLFFRTTLHPNSVQEGNLYLGVLFFSLIHIMCARSAALLAPRRMCLGHHDVTTGMQPAFVARRETQAHVAWGHGTLRKCLCGIGG